jgi:hypothetical protein
MAMKDDTVGRSGPCSAGPTSPEEFAKSLKRRRDAALGLEQDLLTEVPLLYGSPGSLEPRGDPGVLLAQTHREEMLRRNGGGILGSSSSRSEVILPFERLTTALAVLIFLLFVLNS